MVVMRRGILQARAVWLAGAAAILPTAVIASLASPVAATAPARFLPPAGPMVLTRTLSRPIPGGFVVSTRRSYEVQFVSTDEGFRIDGRLIDVEIEVPPEFAALGALEKSRSDEGMFPMQMDSRGHLVSVGAAKDRSAVRKAVALATGKLDTYGLKPADAVMAKNFVGQFARREGGPQWPVELFRPVPGKRSESRTVPLPDGSLGEVSIDFDVRTSQQTGLLESFSRTVVTKLAGSREMTREVWTLLPG